MSDPIQIPAGDFGPIIDGHAWWIVGRGTDDLADRMLDSFLIPKIRRLGRSCDTCDGGGDVEGDVRPHRVEGGSLSCAYCNNTFTFNMMRDEGPFVCSCSRSVEARRTPCPADCIDGRHTFPVEVEQPAFWSRDEQVRYGITPCDSQDCCAPLPREHRLSIVPRMILPLVQVDEHNTVGHYIVRVNDRWFRIDNSSLPVTLHGEVFDLPSDARPGRWAVQCTVAPQ